MGTAGKASSSSIHDDQNVIVEKEVECGEPVPRLPDPDVVKDGGRISTGRNFPIINECDKNPGESQLSKLSSRLTTKYFHFVPEDDRAVKMASPHAQDKVLSHSLTDPTSFWARQAEHLHWHKKPSAAVEISKKTLPSGVTHDTWKWFPDGEISTCYNCIDRHVLAGRGESPAIFYDSPVTQTKRAISYKELLEEVETLAGVLREEGVKRGDVVLIYSTFFLVTFAAHEQMKAHNLQCP